MNTMIENIAIPNEHFGYAVPALRRPSGAAKSKGSAGNKQ